jgi:hypothetical protein
MSTVRTFSGGVGVEDAVEIEKQNGPHAENMAGPVTSFAHPW